MAPDYPRAMSAEIPSDAPEAHPVPQHRPLSAAEARVLGTLMEKARTVPDSYPLMPMKPAAPVTRTTPGARGDAVFFSC